MDPPPAPGAPAAPRRDAGPRRSWTDPVLSTSPRTLARVAGLLYLVIFVCALFSELVVRQRLIEPGDAAATAEAIAGSEGLFRAGFLADLVAFSADVATGILIYVLLRPVSRTLALLATGFRLVQSAVLGMNLLNQLMAIVILDDAGDLGAFDQGQIDDLVLLSMSAHTYGYLIALVFFASHLLIIGYLVWRSGFLPRALGALLALAGVGYLADSLMFFLIPGYEGAASPLVLAPAIVAEAGLILWLLIKGVDVQRWRERSEAPSAPRPADAPIPAGTR